MFYFMFAMECASKLRECGCSSFDVETVNNEFGWYRAKCFSVCMPDKQYQREAVDTVCPRYNAPRYNADSGITRSTVAPEN